MASLPSFFPETGRGQGPHGGVPRSAAARDVLREDGKEQTEGRVSEDNLAAYNNLAHEGGWPHITEAKRRVGYYREIVRGEPGIGAVLEIEDVGKRSVDCAIEPNEITATRSRLRP